MIDRIITTNLRNAQAYDEALRGAPAIESAAREAADKILTTRNSADRAKLIRNLADDIKATVFTKTLPSARNRGERAANDILAKTPPPETPGEPIRRRLADTELRRRVSARAEIAGEQIDAAATRLNARLSKYWREPGESTEGKAERLREIHAVQEKRRATYEANLKSFYRGETKTRPGKPSLDFLSDFVSDVKAEVRSQARRIGTDAELMRFERAGYTLLLWVTPNGHGACPDCQKRQGAVLTREQWEALGRPGSGMTVCGDNCFCVLVPHETLRTAPSLAKRDDEIGRGSAPMTTPAQMAIFNRNRAVTA
jgi:hypothetical protein